VTFVLVYISGRPDGRTLRADTRFGVHQRAAWRPHLARSIPPWCISVKRQSSRCCSGADRFWTHQRSGVTAAVAADDGVLVSAAKRRDGGRGWGRRGFAGRQGRDFTAAVAADVRILVYVGGCYDVSAFATHTRSGVYQRAA